MKVSRTLLSVKPVYACRVCDCDHEVPQIDHKARLHARLVQPRFELAHCMPLIVRYTQNFMKPMNATQFGHVFTCPEVVSSINYNSEK